MKPAHRKIVLASSFVAFTAACGWVGASSFSPASLVAAVLALGPILHSFFKLLGEVERPEPEHREVVTVTESEVSDSHKSTLSQNADDSIFREVNFAALMKKTNDGKLTPLQLERELSFYDGKEVQWGGEVCLVHPRRGRSDIVVSITLPQSEGVSDNMRRNRVIATFPNPKEEDFFTMHDGDYIIVRGKIETDGRRIRLRECQLIRHERKIK